MERRIFMASLAGGLLAAPLAAEAQPSSPIPRVGFVSPSSLSDQRTQHYFQAFRQGLRELGYVEGQNIAIETRWAEGKYDRLPGLASELVRRDVNVIVAYGTAIQSVQQATGTIPIVAAVMQDPVASGFIVSLARPGRNVTGVSTMIPEMIGKQLEILKVAVPRISRVAILGNPDNTSKPQMEPVNASARALGVQLEPVDARSAGEIDAAFATISARRADAVVVLPDAVLFDNRTRIAGLAARRRLPTVSLNVD